MIASVDDKRVAAVAVDRFPEVPRTRACPLEPRRVTAVRLQEYSCAERRSRRIVSDVGGKTERRVLEAAQGGDQKPLVGVAGIAGERLDLVAVAANDRFRVATDAPAENAVARGIDVERVGDNAIG